MSVETGAIVTRPRVWKIPVTDVVIKAVNKLGAAQGFSNKKISGKANQVKLRPADWRTGVDDDGNLTNEHDNVEPEEDGDDDDESDESESSDDDEDDDDDDDDAEDGDENPEGRDEEIRELLASDGMPAPTNRSENVFASSGRRGWI